METVQYVPVTAKALERLQKIARENMPYHLFCCLG